MTARIRSRNQITLPQDIVAATGLTEGAFLSVTVSDRRSTVGPGMIILAPQKLAARPWTAQEWAREEAEVDAEIRAGKLSRRHKGAKAVIAALKKK